MRSRSISQPPAALRGPRRSDRRRSLGMIGAAAIITAALAATIVPAHAASTAPSTPWPLVVTQIVPNPTGDDIYEFFQLSNTTDAAISLTDGSYSLAYSSNTAVPASTRTDYRLTVGGTSTVVPAHGSLVLWNWTPDMSASLTDADFRAFWKTRNPAAPDDYALGRVTGTSGMSNSGSRGIRVLDAAGDNVSFGFYDSGAFSSDRATNFTLPATTRTAQMRVYSTGALAAPGVVAAAQIDASGVTPGASGFTLATSHGADNAYGLIDTDRAAAMLAQMHLMGTVMLVKNGQSAVVSNGLANAATGLANGRDVLYATASLQKAMTATIVMQLVAEGKLRFDSKLSDFVPQAPKAEQITVDMLLTHTSGISMPEMPVYVDPADRSKGQVVLSSQAAQVQNAVATMTVGRQGSFSYSNGNYTMLAAIISAVTGQDFERVMQSRVFDRAGMRDTYFWDGIPESRRSSVAQEYAYTSGADYSTANGPVATPSLQSTLLGAGNLFLTIDDLRRFYVEMNGGALLTSDQYRQLSTSALQNGYAGGLYHYPGNIKRARGSASTDEQGGRYNSFVYGSENNDDLVLVLSNQSLISGNPAPMNGYDAFAENLYLALHTDPVVTSVQPVSAEITVGETLTLPRTVGVVLDGAHESTDLGVVWNTVGDEVLKTPGTHVVTAQVLGLHQDATATVVVKPAATPVDPSTQPSTSPSTDPSTTPTTDPPTTPTAAANGSMAPSAAADGSSNDPMLSAASTPSHSGTTKVIASSGSNRAVITWGLAGGTVLLAVGAGAAALGRRRLTRER